MDRHVIKTHRQCHHHHYKYNYHCHYVLHCTALHCTALHCTALHSARNKRSVAQQNAARDARVRLIHMSAAQPRGSFFVLV